VIESVLNGHCIDIANEKKSSGSKVVTWDRTNGSNQQWVVVPAGLGASKIRSVHAPDMYLGIQDDSVND
jgi:hypothetical protein